MKEYDFDISLYVHNDIDEKLIRKLFDKNINYELDNRDMKNKEDTKLWMFKFFNDGILPFEESIAYVLSNINKDVKESLHKQDNEIKFILNICIYYDTYTCTLSPSVKLLNTLNTISNQFKVVLNLYPTNFDEDE